MSEELPVLASQEILNVIGGYGLVRELGQGGAGHVYECVDEDLNRHVAVKILDPSHAREETARKRFEREGKALAKIDSPYVIGVHKVGVHEGSPYLVLQLAEGPDLQTELDERGPLEVERAVELCRQAALGLAAAHASEVLHRDIKPGNLLLHQGGIKLTDFGLATPIDGSDRLTQAGLLAGTAAFTAPERVTDDTDPRSDLYALGCTLYTLLTGKPPFEGETAIDTLSMHIHDEPMPLRARRPEVPDALAELVARLMEKSPDKRPQTAAETAELLAHVLEETPAPAPEAEPPKAEAEPPKAEPPKTEPPKAEPPTTKPPRERVTPPPETPPLPTKPRISLPVIVGIASVLVLVLLAIINGGNPAGNASLADTLERIEKGEATAILKELDEVPADERDGLHALRRGHVLIALDRKSEAAAALQNAAREGYQDTRGLSWLLEGLDAQDASGRVELLTKWPGEQLDPLLTGLLQDERWWPRHHARAILEARGQKPDLTGLGVLDLEKGETCNKKRYGLDLLREHGRGQAALDALGRVNTSGWMPCISRWDVEQATAAVRGRAAR